MAFTPTEEAGLRVIFNSFVAANYTTPQQVTAMLTRLKLEQELRALESQENNLRAAYAGDTAEFNDALTALNAAQAAKQAEIDAL
ncbi:MAG: hypothetical protein KDI12_20220 [Anaerolineae bacterium]|nr:hypothetical protein [Anaerolineae bacterium]